MWMVRGDRGEMYDLFREQSQVAIGWPQLSDIKPGTPRAQVIATYAKREPQRKRGNIVAGASQVWRFLNEVAERDEVITYEPSQRKYSVGRVTGKAVAKKLGEEMPAMFTRAVQWEHEFERDLLSVATKNSLGSTLTLFRIPDSAAAEVRLAMAGKRQSTSAGEETEDDEQASTPEELFEESAARATEFIKDRISKLDWEEMQELVAGILRAMGYKTRVAKPGPDRGADIYASPDGLGFESPRIVVEVKHRGGQMGSKEIRSFLGGRRHKEDRGLYVSTGGFSKDARYEADRADIPMMLWELNDVVENLTAYYDQLDSDTRHLVPLRRVYWPG
jgi:restriction system protein